MKIIFIIFQFIIFICMNTIQEFFVYFSVDDGYILSPGLPRKYYKFHFENLTWTDAFTVCKEEGASLVNIQLAEEYKVLTALFREQLKLSSAHIGVWALHMHYVNIQGICTGLIFILMEMYLQNRSACQEYSFIAMVYKNNYFCS